MRESRLEIYEYARNILPFKAVKEIEIGGLVVCKFRLYSAESSPILTATSESSSVSCVTLVWNLDIAKVD